MTLSSLDPNSSYKSSNLKYMRLSERLEQSKEISQKTKDRFSEDPIWIKLNEARLLLEARIDIQKNV